MNDDTGNTFMDDRLAQVRALYGQIAFKLKYSRWQDYPSDFIPGCQSEPDEFIIQNNRSRDVVKSCSGGCPYCWVSDTVKRLRRAEGKAKPPMGPEAIEQYVDALVSMGIGIYVGGEDTLDDLESFWWILAAYEKAREKYGTVAPEYLLRPIRHEPGMKSAVEHGAYRTRPSFGFTTCGIYFIRKPECAGEFFARLRQSLAGDTALAIYLSWDPGKVATYARRLRIAEDEVRARMGHALACFGAHFASDPQLGINDQKHKIVLFQHDFGNVGDSRTAQRAFLSALVAYARREIRGIKDCFLKVGNRVEPFIYYTPSGVRWGIKQGRLRSQDFWPIGEFFAGRHSAAALLRNLKFKPLLDFACETLSYDYNHGEFLRIGVTPATLRQAIVQGPFHNPVVRKGGYFRDQVRFALAVVPELAEEPVVSPEEILTCLYSDGILKQKMELLFLLDYLLVTGDGDFELVFMPPELMNFLCADDILEAYLRSCGALQQEGARLTELHGEAFVRATGGVKTLPAVIRDNQEGDRALFLSYLQAGVLPKLSAKGIFGTSRVDGARQESLGAVQKPRLPRPAVSAAG